MFVTAMFVVINMLLTALSLSGTVLVLSAYHHNPERPVPQWMKTFILKHVARLLCLRYGMDNTTRVEPSDSQKNLSISELEECDLKQQKFAMSPAVSLSPAAEEYFRYKNKRMMDFDVVDENKKEWERLSTVLDRLLFVLFVAISVITSGTIAGVIINH